MVVELISNAGLITSKKWRHRGKGKKCSFGNPRGGEGYEMNRRKGHHRDLRIRNYTCTENSQAVVDETLQPAISLHPDRGHQDADRRALTVEP